MRTLRTLGAWIAFLAMVVAASLPWGLPDDWRLAPAFFPVLVLHALNVRQLRPVIPEWLTFLGGVLLDALSQGPLGYWALLYLIAYVLSAYAERLAGEGFLTRWISGAATASAVGAAAYVIAALYEQRLVGHDPFLNSVAVCLAVYPLLDLVLRPFTWWGVPTAGRGMAGGGQLS